MRRRKRRDTRSRSSHLYLRLTAPRRRSEDRQLWCSGSTRLPTSAPAPGLRPPTPGPARLRSSSEISSSSRVPGGNCCSKIAFPPKVTGAPRRGTARRSRKPKPARRGPPSRNAHHLAGSGLSAMPKVRICLLRGIKLPQAAGVLRRSTACHRDSMRRARTISRPSTGNCFQLTRPSVSSASA